MGIGVITVQHCVQIMLSHVKIIQPSQLHTDFQLMRLVPMRVGVGGNTNLVKNMKAVVTV